jgi:oligoribonuclease NrnB/cAMP/cGMP phosphodiesterase (DHH superfamily)
MLSPDLIWNISNEGEIAIDLFVNDGIKWYNIMKEYLTNLFENQLIINYEIYKIIVINSKNLPPPYCDMYITPAITYYCNSLKDPAFNTIAIYGDGTGISLRRLDNCDVDVSILAKQLGGGGHKAAAGCDRKSFNEFFELIEDFM